MEFNANIPQESVEIAPTPVAESRSGFPWQWLLFFVGLSVFFVAIVGIILTLRQPETRSVTNGAIDVSTTPSPSVNAPKTRLSLLSIANLDLLRGQLSEWQNPSTGPFCFAMGDKVCETVLLALDFASTGQVTVESRLLTPEQQKLAIYVANSRMLAGQNAVSDFYRDTLIAGVEPQPYLQFVEKVIQAGKDTQVNPAFILAIYDQLFTQAQELGQGGSLTALTQDFPPEMLAQQYKETLQRLQSGSSDEFEREVGQLNWSVEAQTLASVLSKNLSPDLVNAMFADSAALERRYYEYFAPEDLLGAKKLVFSSAPLSLQAVYGEVDPEGEAMSRIAVCHEKKAFICQSKTSSDLTCQPFDFLTFYCSSIPML